MEQGRVIRPESKDVVEIPQPNRKMKGNGREKLKLEVFHDRFARTGERVKAMATPNV